MIHKSLVPDKSIDQKVAHQLVSRGFRAPCNLVVQTRGGVVTVSGKVEYEHQRVAVLHVIRGIDGVVHTVDHMQVAPKQMQQNCPG
jgi:osmotically-inducible protein OsmY